MNKALFIIAVVLIVCIVVIHMQQQQINQLKSSLSYANTEVISQNSLQTEEEFKRNPIGFKVPNNKSEDED